MSYITSYAVSYDDSVEAILLEDDDDDENLFFQRVSPPKKIVGSKESTYVSISDYLQHSSLNHAPLKDVSNKNNKRSSLGAVVPRRPAARALLKSEEKQTARSRYNTLRSAQQFTSPKREAPRAAIAASREVALKWLEMGGSSSSSFDPTARAFERFHNSSSQYSLGQSSLQLADGRPGDSISGWKDTNHPLNNSNGSWRQTSASIGHHLQEDRILSGNHTSRATRSNVTRGKSNGIEQNLLPDTRKPPGDRSQLERLLAVAQVNYHDYANDRGGQTTGRNSTSASSRSKHHCASGTQQLKHSQPRLSQGHRDLFTMSSGGSHWKSAADPRTGRTYFYHEITRETQWRKPMELASDEEQRTMEEKERKQKDFFSSMEANILNSLSQGIVPGTSSKPSVARRKSSRKPPQGDGRPELTRTISSMDESVLKNLIRRQPSFRNVKKKNSLQVGDLVQPKRGSALGAGDFESFFSIKDDRERLDSVHESNNDDSLPELFSYLPDEEGGEDEYSLDSSLDFGQNSAGTLSSRSDGGKLNESSISGFGLTWEETQALKKLASITKEMIDAEDDEGFDLAPFAVGVKGPGDAGATPSWKGAKDSKAMRDLPREIEFDDDSESEGGSPPKQSRGQGHTSGSGFQKPRDLGGPDLDLEDSDSEAESDMAPAPVKQKSVRISEEKKCAKTEDIILVRPTVKRRNTCGTMYVGTTMSAPDKDATIKCVCGVYRTHILSSEQDTNYNQDSNPFTTFNDLESEQAGFDIKFHNDEQPKSPIPTLEEITRFYREIFYKAQMETDCIIMSLIYVERLIKRTNGALRPRQNNWRSLIFSSMILSSKVWDDLSMWNADFSQSCPPGVTFTLKRINDLELSVLNALGFQVKVPASEYAKYYFLLRSMLIKSGLGGDEMGSLNPLDVVSARRLQEVSAQFENLKLSEPASLSKRSQSLDVYQLSRQNKVNLEHVVKM